MDIYEPAEDSYFLQEYVKQHAKGRVLDVGTGSGILAQTAAQQPLTREVLAVDINERALEEYAKTKHRKVTVKKSDLFSQVHGVFDVIICNPPYLPQDKGIEDVALYGGKKGWEYAARFFSQVASYLAQKGKILFLFSSLTNKEKIDELLSHHLLTCVASYKQKIAFETLYVYIIERSEVLNFLSSREVKQISYIAKGKRGLVYRGKYNLASQTKSHFAKKKEVCVAIKTLHPQSKALATIEKEATYLQRVNRLGIGPRFYFSSSHAVVMEWIQGESVLQWIEHASCRDILHLLKKLLEQCYTLDNESLNKEEMHHPFKHVIVREGEPVLLDFERMHKTSKPKNVTQCAEFICRLHKELEKKGLVVHVDSLRLAAQHYKTTLAQEEFILLVNLLFSFTDNALL